MMEDFNMSDAMLILADGTVYCGKCFGRQAPSYGQLMDMSYQEAPVGELVFNTTMGAYHEIITDPSYAGQSIVMTSVHIGNYGMDDSWNQMIGDTPLCKSLILHELYDGPIPSGRIPLAEMMKQWNICGLERIDTRSLTLHIRDKGSMYSVIVGESNLSKNRIRSIVDWLSSCPPMEDWDFVSKAAIDEPKYMPTEEGSIAHYALWDFGIKKSIVTQLHAHAIDVTIFPCSQKLEDILTREHHFDALFLSNGPGDPGSLEKHVEQIGNFIGKIPILGICLGHQLAARAIGATTEKMLFGHHGANHPVRDLNTQNVYVTAQNHGYCVVEKTLPETAETWLINDNDGSLEGFYDSTRGVMTVQFHPEAAPGPWEARKIFQTFITFAKNYTSNTFNQEVSHAR
jgi:carbamoyl-phosphate synthase small subunit